MRPDGKPLSLPPGESSGNVSPGVGRTQAHRVLGVWDLTRLNIAANVRLRWRSMAAPLEPSALGLWLLGLPLFFRLEEVVAPGKGEFDR